MEILLEKVFRSIRADDLTSYVSEFGRGFLVADPEMHIEIPSAPNVTMRIDRKALLSQTVDEFANDTPVYTLQRKPSSVYSFISIGRTDNCDVALPNQSVSKLHALIREERDGVFTVEDAKSANGTFVNGNPAPVRNRAETLELKSGDRIRFGNLEFQFYTIEGLKDYLDNTKTLA